MGDRDSRHPCLRSRAFGSCRPGLPRAPAPPVGAQCPGHTPPVGLGEMLCPANLLFLRHIESVRWSAPDGSSAEHLRQSEDVSPGVRRVTILGGPHGDTQFVEEQWLIFSQAARADDGRAVGHVEIAFRLDPSLVACRRIEASGVTPADCATFRCPAGQRCRPEVGVPLRPAPPGVVRSPAAPQ